MAKVTVDVSEVEALAASAVDLAKEAADLTERLAEKGTGNEPDGLVPNALSDLCEAVQTLGQNIQTLAEAVAEMQKP